MDNPEFKKLLFEGLAKLNNEDIAKIRKEYNQMGDYSFENSFDYEDNKKIKNPFPFNPNEANLISNIEYHRNDNEHYYVFITRLLDDMGDFLGIYYDLTKNSFDDDGETLNSFDLSGLDLAKHQDWFNMVTPLPIKIEKEKLTLKSKLTMAHLVQFAESLSNLYALKSFLVSKDDLFEIKVKDND